MPGAPVPLPDIRVLFCSPGFPRSRELLRERLAGSPLRIAEVEPGRSLESQVAEASALIPSMARISAAVIDAAPLLKLIVQFGAGLEGVDRPAAEARGIPVRNVPGANAQAVAEMAAFLMLALARGLPQHRRSFAARVVGDPAGSELRGKTLGVVGLGASGRALAGIACGFGMDVIAVGRTPAPDPHTSWVGGPGDLDALLARADFVSLHVPASAETRGLIDATRLARMKRSAYLVNVSRGEVVDRPALLDALRQRRIAGAGLDVYWEEPPEPGDPLFALDNVVATPHLGGVTQEALVRIADRVAAMLREFLLGARAD
ncbi:MAG TPA: 2-hydroxyacid dehydrogenase [Vicinamibacteria bacterium]|nr:2-hydroxyacid dehydrogenase [Vicinamibacteria bacterium]